MLQQDYLMRMFTALAIAMRESMLRAQGDEDPEGAAELLEAALDKTPRSTVPCFCRWHLSPLLPWCSFPKPILRSSAISHALSCSNRTIFLKLDSMSVPPCEPNKHRLLRVLMASN